MEALWVTQAMVDVISNVVVEDFKEGLGEMQLCNFKKVWWLLSEANEIMLLRYLQYDSGDT